LLHHPKRGPAIFLDYLSVHWSLLENSTNGVSAVLASILQAIFTLWVVCATEIRSAAFDFSREVQDKSWKSLAFWEIEYVSTEDTQAKVISLAVWIDQCLKNVMVSSGIALLKGPVIDRNVSRFDISVARILLSGQKNSEANLYQTNFCWQSSGIDNRKMHVDSFVRGSLPYLNHSKSWSMFDDKAPFFKLNLPFRYRYLTLRKFALPVSDFRLLSKDYSLENQHYESNGVKDDGQNRNGELIVAMLLSLSLSFGLPIARYYWPRSNKKKKPDKTGCR